MQDFKILSLRLTYFAENNLQDSLLRAFWGKVSDAEPEIVDKSNPASNRRLGPVSVADQRAYGFLEGRPDRIHWRIVPVPGAADKVPFLEFDLSSAAGLIRLHAKKIASVDDAAVITRLAVGLDLAIMTLDASASAKWLTENVPELSHVRADARDLAFHVNYPSRVEGRVPTEISLLQRWNTVKIANQMLHVPTGQRVGTEAHSAVNLDLDVSSAADERLSLTFSQSGAVIDALIDAALGLLEGI